MNTDVRWKQRFDNYSKAFLELSADVALRQSRELSRLEEKGLIHSFEVVHDLAWNVLKDYLEDVAGTTGLLGSKDSTREAFKRGLIADGEVASLYQQKLTALDDLKNSLLHQAFSGQL